MCFMHSFFPGVIRSWLEYQHMRKSSSGPQIAITSATQAVSKSQMLHRGQHLHNGRVESMSWLQHRFAGYSALRAPIK